MSPATSILDMHSLKARSFLREDKQYVNFSMPPYFKFNEVLMAASSILNNKSLQDICLQESGRSVYPSSCADVNYTVLDNKDGAFAWRQMQILHPVLYVDLMNLITTEDNWLMLTKFFKNSVSKVECISMPLESNTSESNAAEQVNNWWRKIEQRSIEAALDYRYIFQTDITNCYPSIYTHSFEWALHPGGREDYKRKYDEGGQARKDARNLGKDIDIKLRNMNRNQTVGIPQGSTLMDFLAEIVLKGVDLELTKNITETLSEYSDEKYLILRYRDDYRILTNNFKFGHNIMKNLSSILFKWNFRMNSSKTSESSDVITASIKQEKQEEIYISPQKQSYQKEALRILDLSKKYPNSGIVAKRLSAFFLRIDKYLSKSNHKDKVNAEAVLSILVMTGTTSPKLIPQISGTISRLIEIYDKSLDRNKIISRIVGRFNDIPNSEMMDIWMQRIISKDLIISYDFKSAITDVAKGKCGVDQIWNSQWLAVEERRSIESASISDLKPKVEEGLFDPVPGPEEFLLYRHKES